jgi:hypothetical protein
MMAASNAWYSSASSNANQPFKYYNWPAPSPRHRGRRTSCGLRSGPDHRLGREPMTEGVVTGTLFAFWHIRTGAFASIAPVGLGLPERSHCEVMAFSIEFGPPLHSLRPRLALPAATEVGPSMRVLSEIGGSGCVSSHSTRAKTVGSIPALFHHVASSPERCTSR